MVEERTRAKCRLKNFELSKAMQTSTQRGNAANPYLKGAIVGGIVNAIINGVINWLMVKDQETVLLTQNLISSTEKTVFSNAVPLAVSLAFIITTIAYFTTKTPNKPSYFPKVFLLALKHTVFAFGLVTIAGLLIQRYAGSIAISPIASALIAAITAGCVSGLVEYETKKAIAQ